MHIDEMFPSPFVKASDLDGREPTVTIARVAYERIKNQDGAEEEKPVVWFVGKEKSLILNKTNATSIAELHGPDTDAWTGKQIKLITARVEAFGKQADAIRIAPPANNLNTPTPSMAPNEEQPAVHPQSTGEDQLPF